MKRKILIVGVSLLLASACKLSVGTDTQAQQTPPEVPPADPAGMPMDAPPPVDPMAGPEGLPLEPPAVDPGAPLLPPPTDAGVVAAPPADPSVTGGRTTLPMVEATPMAPAGRPGAPPAGGPPAVTSGAPGAPGAAAPVDLVTAIKGAAAQGRVVGAKRKDKRGLVGYEIEVLGANGALTEMELGPDGKPIPAAGSKTKMDQKMAAAASVTKVTIDQAIQTALKTAPGTVEEAQLSASKGFATWEIEIRTATGQKSKLKIDAGTGQVVPY